MNFLIKSIFTILCIPYLIESAVASFKTVGHKGSNTLINSHKVTIFSGSSSSSQPIFDNVASTLPSYGYDVVTSEIQPKQSVPSKNIEFDMPKQGSFLRSVQVPNFEPRLGVQSGMFRPTTSRFMSQRSASFILGISVDASEQEIKNAYRKKALELHPDLAGGNQEAMKLLNQARDVLMKKNKITDDDKTGAEGKGPKKGFSTKTKAAVAGIVGTRAAIVLKELMDDFKDRAEQTKKKEEKDLKLENRPENMSTSRLNDERYDLGYTVGHYFMGYERSPYTHAYTKKRLAEINTELVKRRLEDQHKNSSERQVVYEAFHAQ